MPSHQGGQYLAAGFEGDIGHLDAGVLGQQAVNEISSHGRAGGPEGELAGIFLRFFHQVLQRLLLGIGLDNDEIRCPRPHPGQGEIVQLVVQLLHLGRQLQKLTMTRVVYPSGLALATNEAASAPPPPGL